MILLSIWLGLRFSNKILEPILSIIIDSQKIIEGNFSSRIREIKGKDEFSFLSKLLNKMLDTLKIQKNKLIKAKETINLRRKFTEKIINEVNNGIIYLDLNLKILIFNKRSEEIFGKDFKKKFLKQNTKIYQFISKFNTSKSNFNEDQFKYFLDGKLKILNLKISKVYEKKSFKGMIMSIDDVTELVAAQKNAAWSNVARYMAHEIKNPLTPIKLSAQRILNSLNVKDSDNKLFYKNCLNTIVRQVNNIEGLVTEFSNFARMPESKLELVNINKIIKSQIETQKIVKKDVNFSFINSKKKLSIMCDFNQINRLIMNILKNSTESLSKKKKKLS